MMSQQLARRFRVTIGEWSPMVGETRYDENGGHGTEERYRLDTLSAASIAHALFVAGEMRIEVNGETLYRGPAPVASTTEYQMIRFTERGVPWVIESMCVWPGVRG